MMVNSWFTGECLVSLGRHLNNAFSRGLRLSCRLRGIPRAASPAADARPVGRAEGCRR